MPSKETIVKLPAPAVRKTKGRADSIDEHVGTQLRRRRCLLNLSQEKLAEGVGVTFQQIQKYENGANRMSASRLFQFSKILSIPVDFFFEGYKNTGADYRSAAGFGEGEQASFDGPGSSGMIAGDDVMKRKETLELIRVYYAIENPKLRKDYLKLGRSMAQSMKNQEG